MLKKLVIVGSLLAVGPLLAGCPGAVVVGVHAIPLVLEVADATVEGIASVTKKTPKRHLRTSTRKRRPRLLIRAQIPMVSLPRI